MRLRLNKDWQLSWQSSGLKILESGVQIPLGPQTIKNGPVSEWLGGGLQNRLRWFKSNRDLNKMPPWWNRYTCMIQDHDFVGSSPTGGTNKKKS